MRLDHLLSQERCLSSQLKPSAERRCKPWSPAHRQLPGRRPYGGWLSRLKPKTHLWPGNRLNAACSLNGSGAPHGGVPSPTSFFLKYDRRDIRYFGGIAQLVRAVALQAIGQGFESPYLQHGGCKGSSWCRLRSLRPVPVGLVTAGTAGDSARTALIDDAFFAVGWFRQTGRGWLNARGDWGSKAP